ncbi:MAG: winged helix-turn-helix domain-containing protein [Aliarcobacter sp.]|nr:winged helix-turn-helix domain-containing protein [Aliarcobacter sp.]
MITLKRINISFDKTIISNNDILELGVNQRYNLQNQTFYINNKVINLTKKENDILYILCKNLNQNISYECLLEYVWGDKNISNSTIRDTISRLK